MGRLSPRLGRLGPVCLPRVAPSRSPFTYERLFLVFPSYSGGDLFRDGMRIGPNSSNGLVEEVKHCLIKEFEFEDARTKGRTA